MTELTTYNSMRMSFSYDNSTRLFGARAVGGVNNEDSLEYSFTILDGQPSPVIPAHAGLRPSGTLPKVSVSTGPDSQSGEHSATVTATFKSPPVSGYAFLEFDVWMWHPKTLFAPGEPWEIDVPVSPSISQVVLLAADRILLSSSNWMIRAVYHGLVLLQQADFRLNMKVYCRPDSADQSFYGMTSCRVTLFEPSVHSVKRLLGELPFSELSSFDIRDRKSVV